MYPADKIRPLRGQRTFHWFNADHEFPCDLNELYKAMKLDFQEFITQLLEQKVTGTHEERHQMAKTKTRTSHPTEDDLTNLYHLTKSSAEALVLSAVITREGHTYAAGIRSALAVLHIIHPPNNEEARNALTAALAQALGPRIENWATWTRSIQVHLTTIGVRDEITSTIPFHQAWLNIARALDDITDETFTKQNRAAASEAAPADEL